MLLNILLNGEYVPISVILSTMPNCSPKSYVSSTHGDQTFSYTFCLVLLNENFSYTRSFSVNFVYSLSQFFLLSFFWFAGTFYIWKSALFVCYIWRVFPSPVCCFLRPSEFCHILSNFAFAYTWIYKYIFVTSFFVCHT